MLRVGFIGFGEAAQAFAAGWRENDIEVDMVAYDLLFDDQDARAGMMASCERLGVAPLGSAAEVKAEAGHVVAAVTADQVLAAAESVGPLEPEQAYLDINSAAPEKKKRAAAIVGPAYLDVAVLAPVHPGLHATPMLVGGAHAQAEAAAIGALFPGAEVFSDVVGEASLVKMIRSIFVKGLEAVTMECALAAYKAGLAERVFPSLDVVLRHTETKALADYTMERVALHGKRRAAEMEEVCDTLADLGLPNAMSQGSVIIQRLVGELDVAADFGTVPQDAEGIAAALLARLSR